MPTSGDTDIPSPAYPKEGCCRCRPSSKLAAVSLRMRQKYGPPRAIVTQPESILKSAAVETRALRRRPRTVDPPRAEGVRRTLLGRARRLEAGAAFVRDWLRLGRL